MNLFLRRLPRLRPSLPLDLTTPFHRLLSTTIIPAPPQNPQFVVVDYLIQSCNLSSDEAVRASKYIRHLKSPDKPDSVLRFLRHAGIRESDIRTAVSRNPRFLCSHVENNWRPNVAKLQEVGFSIEEISDIISRRPVIFQSNFVQKVDFWMLTLGSLENMSVLLKKGPSLLQCNLEKVLEPNLLFLQKQCGLSVCQIVRLINQSASRLIGSKPEAMKLKVKKAEELGVSCSSQKFVYALITVSSLNGNTLNSRIHYLKSIGLSQKEVTCVISKAPEVLKISEESLGRKMELLKSMGLSQDDVTCVIGKFPAMLHLSDELLGRKMEFLMKEVGCGKIDVVRNPALFGYNMENRMVPRNIVRKILMLKGLPVANLSFATFAWPSNEKFVEKFVQPYEHHIPGLSQAYANACSGNIEAIK
ncbi:uncharacterized protein LOC144575805 [Carex rostrata]